MLQRLFFLFAGLGLVTLNVQAALPAGLGTSLEAIETDIATLEGLVWPIILTIMGTMILIRLARKYSSRIG